MSMVFPCLKIGKYQIIMKKLTNSEFIVSKGVLFHFFIVPLHCDSGKSRP